MDRFSLHTAVGEMLLGFAGDNLVICDWADKVEERGDIWRRVESICDSDASAPRSGDSEQVQEIVNRVARTANAISDYLEGYAREIDIPFRMTGTEFQIRVWIAIMAIPYGDTISYSALARKIGCPGAVRAVASACRANSLSLIIPCHCVVREDGNLGLYAGGREAKKYLIDLERKYKASPRDSHSEFFRFLQNEE